MIYQLGKSNENIIIITKLLPWFKCRDLTEKIHLFYINNRLSKWYAHGSQDLTWKFSQVVSDSKNNQKLGKGSKIIFILAYLTRKLIYIKTNSVFKFNTNKDMINKLNPYIRKIYS